MRNLGMIDRIVRLVVAIVAVVMAIGLGGIWGVAFWIVAAIMALTGVAGFCPIYKVLGVSTQHKTY